MNQASQAPADVLHTLNAGIAKGMQGAGLRPNVRPEQIQRTCNDITGGDAQEIAALFLDVMGETAGLAAGQSLYAQEAMQAINEAQAAYFVALREMRNHQRQQAGQTRLLEADLSGCRDLLKAHQKALIQWVRTAHTPKVTNTTCYSNDLNLIGRILDTEELRAGVVSAWIGATEVMAEGIGLFTQTK